MRLEEYAVVGDCHTAALIARNGSIDWLCWPNFGGDACFARLLGTEENGFWKIAPTAKKVETTRRYCGDSFILETTHVTRTGTVVVTDFMPPRNSHSQEHSQIIRTVRGLHGSVKMRSEFVLRFSFGSTVPWVTKTRHGIRCVAGPDSVELHATIPLVGVDHRTVSDFTIHAGKSESFVLTCGDYANYQEHALPRTFNVEKLRRQTSRFWHDWAKRCTYQGPYREEVMRSLLVLKALTYAPSGGIVAAPTTSLPERIGGTRNWDYRYCWLRDTTFTLFALFQAGYHDEAYEWMHWLRRTIAGNPEAVQIMYGVNGERQLFERELSHLRGYEKSLPVRLGNGAYEQLQLDIYGEVLAAFSLAFSGRKKLPEDDFHLLCHLVEHLEHIWHLPDQGIWETRNGPQHFTYSKVMSWVAFDRAIHLAERFGYAAPLARWRRVRNKIHREVCRRGFNKRLNSFTQAYGSTELDAACLLIPLVGFLPADDPRVHGTVEAIEKYLLRDGFVRRYNTASQVDGFDETEGAFLACSFWLASNYKLIGRDADAVALFTRLIQLTNDLGLLAEQYDTRRKRQCGNFPQAFSHISLVGTAFRLMHG